jgi:hypothetical protein
MHEAFWNGLFDDVASSSIISNEAMYGPFGAVMTLLTAEIGLGVALQLGAVVGATAGRDKTLRPPSGQIRAPAN